MGKVLDSLFALGLLAAQAETIEFTVDGRLKKEGCRYRYDVPHGYTLMLR